MVAAFLFISLIALLPLVAFTYVTWRLVRHRERVASVITGLVAIGLLVLQPITQFAADSLIGKPYVEKKRRVAEEAELVGKDFASVVARLGKPGRSRVERPLISNISTRAIIQPSEPYTVLEYFPTRAIYMRTSFMVFLDAAGTVKSYSVENWD